MRAATLWYLKKCGYLADTSMIDGKKIVVVMPAYNASRTLERTVSEVPALVDEIILGDKVSEYHTGYRAFSRKLLLTLPPQENADGFVFDNQVLVQAVHVGFRIAEVTGPTKYFGEASSIGFAKRVPPPAPGYRAPQLSLRRRAAVHRPGARPAGSNG